MKVVVVNYAYDESLASADELLARYHSLTGWCEALAAAGARVTVVQRFRQEGRVTRAGVEYRFHDNRLLRRSHFVEVADADVVHVNGLDFPIETRLLRPALRADAALVVQDHASGDPPASRSLLHAARRSARRRLMQAVDGFLFTSKAQAGAWQRAGLIAPTQPVYEVLEASTNVKPLDRHTARQATGLDGSPAILWVGRLNANKDPLTVLDGFERSLASVPSGRLTMIYGEGDLLTPVTDRIRGSRALSRSVQMIGSVSPERMPSFYSAADLFVVGSHHEGSGYALVEACACGLMPAVTDIPAFHAITGGGSIGRLWPAGDASSLADAIAQLTRVDRGVARARVLAHFERTLSWPAVAEAAMRAYRDAVAGRRAKTA